MTITNYEPWQITRHSIGERHGNLLTMGFFATVEIKVLQLVKVYMKLYKHAFLRNGSLDLISVLFEQDKCSIYEFGSAKPYSCGSTLEGSSG